MRYKIRGYKSAKLSITQKDGKKLVLIQIITPLLGNDNKNVK